MPPDARSGSGGFEFEYGTPNILRGRELFALASPGGEIVPGESDEANPKLLHYRRQNDQWRAAVLPFAPGAAHAWWGLTLTPDGETLALTTQHNAGYHIDFYQRKSETFRYTVSLPLSMGANGNELICTASHIVASGPNQVVVFGQRSGHWSEERRIQLPSPRIAGRGTNVSMVSSGEWLVLSRADKTLWQVDAKSGKVAPVFLPPGMHISKRYILALHGSRLFMLHGKTISWWTLSRLP